MFAESLPQDATLVHKSLQGLLFEFTLD